MDSLLRVYCPRCGTPNEQGDRYCSSCGAELRLASSSKAEAPPIRERLGRLVGTTRKARLTSIATVAALVVAVAAFILLKPSGDEIPRDAYTISADRLCLEAKARIVEVERRSVEGPASAQNAGFAQTLVPVVSAWRSRFQKLDVPADRIEKADEMRTALLETEIALAKLARAEAGGDRAAVLATAKRADTTTTHVEEAASSLGLDECAQAAIGFSAPG